MAVLRRVAASYGIGADEAKPEPKVVDYLN
jgi:hypothetical protein